MAEHCRLSSLEPLLNDPMAWRQRAFFLARALKGLHEELNLFGMSKFADVSREAKREREIREQRI
jgi:hypothetical protein